MPYSIETFRKEMQAFCRSLPGAVSIPDTGTTFSFSDELAFPVPMVIRIAETKTIVVLVSRRGLISLLENGNTVWLLNPEQQTVEVFGNGTSRMHTIPEVQNLLRELAAVRE